MPRVLEESGTKRERTVPSLLGTSVSGARRNRKTWNTSSSDARTGARTPWIASCATGTGDTHP
eukprot:6325855-Amphidinium_carterae.1